VVQTRSRPSCVLMVEDEALICEMMADALAEQGFEVHAVATADDALRHLICGAPCDVLFTDVNLPGGTDGTALARLARELRPGLPVVYASGAVARLAPEEAVPGGTFIAKPYNPDRVCTMLGRIAAGRG